MVAESRGAALYLAGDPQAAAAMMCGDRVVYTGERSPDYPDAAYRGTVREIDDDGTVYVLFDDGVGCEVALGDLAGDAGVSGAGGDGR